MKIVKKIVYSILILMGLVIIVSLFFPTQVEVERQISIDATAEEIFPNVNQMANWKKWGGPWQEDGMDFNEVIQRTEGSEFGIGSKLIYDKGDGEGSVEIIESEEFKRIKTLITFEDGGTANGHWTFETDNNSTVVKWKVSVSLGYNPIKRIMGNLMMDGTIGPVFEKGLQNLKQVSE